MRVKLKEEQKELTFRDLQFGERFILLGGAGQYIRVKDPDSECTAMDAHSYELLRLMLIDDVVRLSTEPRPEGVNAKSLAVGDVFKSGGCAYMKTELLNDNIAAAIDLGTGEAYHCEGFPYCFKIDGTFTEEE